MIALKNKTNMESGNEEKKKISFGINLADDRIKLIDILSDDNDDDFLVASDNSFQDCFAEGFRLSGFGNSKDDEIKKQHSNVVDEPRRPSFLRRSLDWDSAFFNSAGILDPDELSFINKGIFGTNQARIKPEGKHDVRERRCKSESRMNRDGSSVDWFEIEPFGKTRRSNNKIKSGEVANTGLDSDLKKDGLPKIQQAIKKVDISLRNKIKSTPASTRKSTSVYKTDKMHNEKNNRSHVHGAVSPSKQPKNVSNRPIWRDPPGKSNATMENRGKFSVSEKKAASKKNTIPCPNQSLLSLPKLSSAVSSTASSVSFSSINDDALTPRASFSLPKIRMEPRKSCVSSISSTSKSRRKMMNNHPSSPIIIGLDANKTSKSHFNLIPNDGKGSKDCQNRLVFSDKETSETMGTPKITLSPLDQKEGVRSVGSRRSIKSLRPSGFCPPSPKIGFFDENTPPISRGATTTRRKMPHQIVPSSSKGPLSDINTKFGSPKINESIFNSKPYKSVSTNCKKNTESRNCKDSAMNTKRSTSTNPQDMHMKTCSGNLKRPRNKHIGPSSSLEEEKRTCLLKRSCKESSKDNSSDDDMGKLSKYFNQAIDLNESKAIEELTQEKEGTNISLVSNENDGLTLNSRKLSEHVSPSSVARTRPSNHSRTPLADRTSVVSNLIQ